MEIRRYRAEDCEVLAELFFDTVHSVNAKDYSQEQLAVWATGRVDLEAWNTSFLQNNTVVVEKDDRIAGFGDMDDKGYLDRLYVHKNYQNQGIAKAIVLSLEKEAYAQGIREFTTYASITAKPFFQRLSYSVLHENEVVRQGVLLKNYFMSKSLD